MTDQTSTLQHLIALAKKRRDRRLQQVAEAQRLVQQARTTLESLQQYRAERLVKRRAQLGENNQRVMQQTLESRFDIKLVSAVTAQTGRVEQADSVRDERLHTARDAQNRVVALQVLARRRAERARQRAVRREQNATDEFVANAAHRDDPHTR